MKRLVRLLLLLALAATGQAAGFLGTFPEDAEVVFYWNTYDDNGASVTRATNGTVKVIRDDQTDCTGTSVTDTEDSLDTGVHLCKVDTSDGANYAVSYTYTVWIDGAVVDGDTVNGVLATFSIEDRFVNVAQIESADATDTIRDSVVDDATRIDASEVNATCTSTGRVESDLVYIHGTALTETGGQLAGRFVNFFDQATAGYNVSTALASFKATGFSTHDAAAVVTALGTGGTLTDCATATGFSTHDAAAVLTAFGTGAALTDCATAAGFSTHDAAAVVTALGTGTTLTALPWNGDWDAQVESECADALVAINLDHLMLTGVANNADMTAEVADGTVLSNVMSSSSDTSTYVVADDSLQGISEGAAGGGATAQQVWEYATRTLTAATNLTSLITDYNLDHLMLTPVANNADMTAEVADGTVLSNVMSSTSDTSTYVVADDSLQGISEGAAGGGATAQQVWEYATRSLTILDEDGTTIDLDSSTVGGLTTWSKTGYTLTNLSDANAAKLEDVLDGTGGTGFTLNNFADFKATGFSTHDAAAVVTALGTGGTLTDCATAAGFSTHDAAAVVTALGTGGTLTDCATATGFSTHSAANVWGVATRSLTILDEDSTTIDLDGQQIGLFTAALATSIGNIETDTGTTLPAALYTPSDDLALLQATTVDTLATQTSFTLTAGSTVDDSYNNQLAILVDAGDATVKSVRRITNYVGATKTVTLASGADFVLAIGDTVRILVVRDTVITVGP